jgi:hypothetical protein
MCVGEVTIKEEAPVEEGSKISKSGYRPLRPSSPLPSVEEDSKIYKLGVGGTARSEKPGNTGTTDGCPGYSAAAGAGEK